jgi:hypothetical protein
MSWPPRQPSRDEIALDDLQAYAEVLLRARSRADVNPEESGGIYGRFLLAPRMAAGFSSVGSAMRTNSNRDDSYTHADREWVDQVLSVLMRSNVLQPMHLADAIAVGVRPEAIEALRSGREAELTEGERQLMEFIECVYTGTMTADVWNGIEVRMGERGVVEYALAVLYIAMGTRLYQVAGMPDPSNAEVDEWLEGYLAGAAPPNDWQRRNI